MSGIIHSWPIEIDFNRAQIRSRIRETDILDFKSEASYIVFKDDGGRIYAKNGSTGMVEYSDTDATKVIQYAIDKVGQAGGGRVFIKKGTYPVSKTITVSGNNIEIVGDYPTILGSPDFTFPILRIYNASNVRVKGLIIDMQADWSTTILPNIFANNIQVANSSDVEIAYNILKNARGYNVVIGVYADTNTWKQSPCDRVWVHHNLVMGSIADGIDTIASKHVIIENNIITGTRDDAIAILAWMDKPVEDVIIRSNIIYGHRFSCFKLAHYYSSSGSYAMNNIFIEGNYCETTIDEDGGAVAIVYESSEVPPDGVGRNIYVLNNIIYTGNVKWHAIAIFWLNNPAPNYTYKNIVIRGNYISAVNDPLDFSTSPPSLKSLYGIWAKANTKVDGLVIENNVIERFARAILLEDKNSAIIRNNVFRYNFDQAVGVWYASGVEISNNYIYDNARHRLYRSDWASNAIFIYNSSDVIVARNVFRAGQTQTYCVGILSNSSNIYVVDNDMFNGYLLGAVSDDNSSTNVVFRRNRGYRTENSGVATIPAGSTRVTVSHGLAKTPSKFQITPLGQPPGKLWVENITSTSFDIVTDTAPATDLNVSWYAEV